MGERPRATLDDVARAAGVSRATASRAVHGGELVSEHHRAAVLRAVADLGYVPRRTPAARTPATRRTDTIAVVVPEIDSRLFSDPFLAATIAGIADVLESTTKQIVLLIRSRGGGNRRMLDFLEGGHVDGVVVVSHHREDHLTDLIVRSRLPATFVGRPFSSHGELQYVDVDNRMGGRMAAEYLASTGARRIATITGPLDMAPSVDRLEGWRDAMLDAGLDPSLQYEGDFTMAGARGIAARVLREHPDVDGVFAASDLMAVGVIGAAHAAGRAIPGDVRVVGFDDSPMAADTHPPLTSITNPGRELGATATHLVLQQLGGRPYQAPVILRPRLVIRETA